MKTRWLALLTFVGFVSGCATSSGGNTRLSFAGRSDVPLGQPVQAATPLARGERELAIRGEQYLRLPEAHAITVRVKGVFDRILRVSGRRPGAVIEVYVLDTPKVLAEALTGGYVVVSRGAVELTGQDDDALAFLLGHEVAHQVLGHHTLLDTRQRLAFQRTPADPARSADLAATQQAMELEADRLGVLYAALAGYRPRAAVPILQRVVEQTGSGPLHPDPRRRAGDIRGTIDAIADHVQLFDVGVFYLASARYDAAARTFENFQSLFPSREVYSNLGVAYHKRALLYQADEELRRSVVVDPGTRAAAIAREPADAQATRPLRLRGRPGESTGPAHPLFAELMRRAVAAYRLAVDSDPDYPLGHVNLGAAYIELGEYDFAIGELKKAIALAPSLKAAYLDRGVAYMRNGDRQRAEEDFRRAADLDHDDPDPHVNLSLLYRVAGRVDDAKRESAVAARLDASRASASTSPTASGRETLGSVAIGAGDDVVRRAFRAAPDRVLPIPLGLGVEARVAIYDAEGVTLVSRQGKLDAAMARDGYAGRSVRGIGIGSTVQEVQTRYGRPATQEGSGERRLWVYPAHRLVVTLQAGRVAGWWVY